jgi:hypothetical protein
MPPRKLNDELIDKLVELVGVGNYIEVAAAACGITGKTYYEYMKIGRTLSEQYGTTDPDDLPATVNDYDRLCLKLFGRMTIANAQAEAFAVATVRKHMPDQWAAAMTFLERRFPGRWKRRDETTVRTPFDPAGDSAEVGGIDERRLLEDPDAIHLLHEALEKVARGQLPAATPPENTGTREPIVDAEVVIEVDKPKESDFDA